MLRTFLPALVIPSGRSEKNNTFHCTILKSVKLGLERARHERASLVSWVGEPLKRIYKASQEKKERTSPRVPKWFLLSPRNTP
jgi:hypothetical protein